MFIKRQSICSCHYIFILNIIFVQCDFVPFCDQLISHIIIYYRYMNITSIHTNVHTHAFEFSTNDMVVNLVWINFSHSVFRRRSGSHVHCVVDLIGDGIVPSSIVVTEMTSEVLARNMLFD